MSVHALTIHPFDPWGSKIGGIESFVRSMLKKTPADWKQSLVGVTEDTQARPLHQWQVLDFQGQPVHFLPLMEIKNPNKRTRIPLFLRFPLALRNHSIDTAPAVAIYHRIEPLVFAPFPTKATILFMHGNPLEMTGTLSEVKWKYIPPLYRLVEAKAINKSDMVFCVSQKGVDYLIDQYPHKKDRIRFLPTWYRDDLFYPIHESERFQTQQKFLKRFQIHKTHSNSRFILFAGRWERQKNPLLALESFAHVARECQDVHLLVAGSGSLENAMKQKVQSLHLQDSTHFLGSLSPIDLADALRISRIFLMTSRFEGMPVVVLESLACGLPVVSTRTGEMDRMILDGITGRIIEKQQPEAIAEGMLDILNHPEVYNPRACSDSVQPFRPACILPGVYDTFQHLA